MEEATEEAMEVATEEVMEVDMVDMDMVVMAALLKLNPPQ